MRARYYLPNTNRWLSPDSIIPNPQNPQSFNRYSYVRNNPVNFTDPTGHRECASDGWCAPGSSESHYQPPDLPPPQVTKLWIGPDDVTEIQLYGNTNFAFNLDGTGPSYAYSQGFHGGLDLMAEPGTEVIAGIHGEVAWVSDRTAYKPRYIVIQIAPDTYMIIGHLSADNLSNLKAGDIVTPDTVVGEVESAEDHAHIEFWTGQGSTASTNRYIETPYQYLSPEVKQQFLALMQDMNEFDSRITFHQRSDGQWSSRDAQPRLKYHGPNLNYGQPGYDNPWD